jgi:hypothetical protein
MSHNLFSRLWFVVATLLGCVLLLTAPQPASPVQAQTSNNHDEPACIRCHEDLYYLHDTGKWFCISKSPMQCVGCHGGDATATTKEAAHQNRTAHPVINGDTTTCRQCHIEDCDERVSAFDAMAGISPVVMVSTPIGPAPAPTNAVTSAPQAAEQTTLVWDWPVALVSALLALGLVVLVWRRSHSRRSNL